MKFYEYGEKNEQVIVMLPGSFCPADALEYLSKDLVDEFHVITIDYNGHYEGGGTFTTRQNEAGEILNVEGNTCLRGDKYARQECTFPLRMITAVIQVENCSMPLSVKTASPVPKKLIPEIMQAYNVSR